ncbi:37913_t:CDS:2 [Gigaspora margarita]|uniref:Integrator complex subunit 7 n=1 Tax=Gigaspora margarita TaxID=4874 RepID=A0ABN7UJK1_GIGMA|nr:37913_t:CDS:2 [Gigaspora margarita]
MKPKRKVIQDYGKLKREILNKLRVAKTVEEQLVQFSDVTRKFDEYPDPNLICNTLSFLAECFRTCDKNEIRYCLLKVFKETEKYIKQTDSAALDHTVKNIFFPLENRSNDTVARAIALRILGYLSILLTDRIDIQHGILQRLDSTFPIEANAAIFAADKLCAKTEKFAVILCDQLETKFQSNDLSMTFRIKLIRILRHMHWEISLAHKSRNICLQMLEQSSDGIMQSAILRTLTLLSCRALVDRSDQVELLMDYAINGSNEYVRSNALVDLLNLAKKDSVFSVSHALRLLNLVVNASEQIIKVKALRILTVLIKRGRLLADLLSQRSDQDLCIEALHSIQNCEDIIHDITSEVSIIAAQFCTELIIETRRIVSRTDILIWTEWNTYISELSSKIQSSFLSIIVGLIRVAHINASDRDMHGKIIKKYLKFLFSMCLSDDTMALNVSRSIIKIMQEYITTNNDDIFAEVSKFILMVGKLRKSIIQTLMQNLIAVLKSSELLQMPRSFTLLAKTALKVPPEVNTEAESFQQMIIATIQSFGQFDGSTICNNQWNIYLIGVDAGKSGCFSVMASIMQFFVTAVDVDASRYWLRALINIATAEKGMVMKVGIDQMFDLQPEQADILDTFEDSIRRYAQGDEELNGFMALMDISNQRLFAKWFYLLRVEFFKTMKSFLEKLNQYMNPRIKRKKKDMVDIQEMLLRAAHMHDFVAHSFFDVDKKSLEILESYRICCLILVYAIKSLLVGVESNQEHIDPSLIPLIPMIRYVNADLNNFTNSWKAGEIDQREKLALYTQSIQILREIEQLKQHKLQSASSNPVLVVRDFVRAMLKIPMNIPPYFFDRQQRTRIHWLDVPYFKGNNKDKAILVQEKLVLKLEGIVQSGYEAVSKKLKSIEMIIFGSNIDFFEKSNPENSLLNNLKFSDVALSYREFATKNADSLPTSSAVVCSVEINNNFFTSSVIFPFPLGKDGFRFINVHTRVVDDQSVMWTIGPDLRIAIE